jgi:hypothetical protein
MTYSQFGAIDGPDLEPAIAACFKQHDGANRKGPGHTDQ